MSSSGGCGQEMSMCHFGIGYFYLLCPDGLPGFTLVAFCSLSDSAPGSQHVSHTKKRLESNISMIMVTFSNTPSAKTPAGKDNVERALQ